MANQKLRDTFDVILGGERTDPAPPAPRSRAATLASREVARFISLAEGGFFYPNFVSDYLMRDLSLGEQSVFNRLLRLTQGIDRPAGRLKLEEVAAACGVSPEFAAKAVQSLQRQGLLRLTRHPPFTRAVRYRLDVLKQWQGKLVLCAVCHGPIRPGDELRMVPLSRSRRGLQEAPVHAVCLDGEPVQVARP